MERVPPWPRSGSRAIDGEFEMKNVRGRRRPPDSVRSSEIDRCTRSGWFKFLVLAALCA